MEIRLKKSLKIRENHIQRHFLYIKTKIKFTTNPAVCPLSDYVINILPKTPRHLKKWLIS